ncbi:hypothetical protein SUGI_0009490 [Cryptomeria japonica]|nr:hypothetical protein SUGI_0009490 [Cryptomeria japonica]
MANRDRPVNSKVSRLRLQKDGVLVLLDADGSAVWRSNTKGLDVKEAELLPAGNLVLRGSSGQIIWQSFDSPTDTLLPQQPFTTNTQLISRMGPENYKSGNYRLFFNDDNYLSLIYEGLNLSSKYWPDPWRIPAANGRNTFNITRIAVLDGSGSFSSSDQFSFNAWDNGEGPLRRLTLDIDGNMRLYSLNSQTAAGKFRGSQFHGSAEFMVCAVLMECENFCLDDCNCLGFGYRLSGSAICYPKYYLISGFQSTEAPNDMYIKISINVSSVTNISSLLTLLPSDLGSPSCSLQSESQPQQQNISSTVGKKRWSNQLVISLVSFASAVGLTEIVCIVLGRWFFIKAFREADVYSRQGYFSIPGGFKRFKFSELKMATNNFRESIGKGRFGSVYKGLLLPENKVVAVKRLEGVSRGEDEFRAELSMIGRVNHMNLVTMFGYCAEANHRLLVYEYVENGSLGKYLFTQDSSRVLDWNTRFQIAVGTARGLAYLHEECLEWILHCDIKPENILLDEHFRAKVSDF